MLPSLRPFLRYIDCEQKIIDHKFTIKVGFFPVNPCSFTYAALSLVLLSSLTNSSAKAVSVSADSFNKTDLSTDTDFVALDPNNGAWNVVSPSLFFSLLR